MSDLDTIRRLDELRGVINGPDEAAAFEALSEYSALLRDNPELRTRRVAARVMLEERRQSEAETARREEYDRYMASPEWQRRRAVAIRKAGGRCQVCNEGGELEVHHRTYERFGAEMEDDLTVLCEGCHELYERHKRLRRIA